MRTLLRSVILLLVLQASSVSAQPFWNSLSGEDLGQIYGIATHGNCIYVGTGNGKILCSTNNGNTWRSWYIDKPAAIATLTTTVSGEVFAATEDGLYRSRDSGVHWTRIVEPLPSGGDSNWYSYISLVITYPPSTVVAIDGYDVHFSLDDGDSWIHSTRLYGAEALQGVIYDPKVIYAGDYVSGLYSSYDSGQTWNRLGVIANGVTLLTRDSSEAFYLGSSGILLRSLDRGHSWDTVWSKPGTTPQSLSCSNNGKLAFTTFEGDIYFSIDSGKTWRMMHTKQGQDFLWELGFTDSLIISNEEGIYAVDPATGKSRSLLVGLSEQTITAAAACSTGYIAATNDGHLYTSPRGTVRWKDVTDSLFFSYISGAVSLDSTILLSTDRGILNFHPSTGTYERRDSVIGPYAIRNILRAENNEIYAEGAGGHGDLYRSVDSGNSWIKCDNGIPGKGVFALAATKQHGIVAATLWGIQVSLNDGVYWPPGSGGISNVEVGGLVVLPDDTVLWASYTSGILKGGPPYVSWTNIALQGVKLTSLWKAPSGDIYAISDSASTQYISRDLGKTWKLAPAYLAGLNTHSIVESEQGEAIASTDGKGLFILSDTTVGWRPVSTSFVSRNVSSLVATSSTVYAASDSGVYASLDSGLSWNRLTKSDSGFVTNSVFATDAGLIIAGMNTNQILRSSDFGNTWSRIIPFTGSNFGAWSFFAGEKGVYLCSQAGVFVSSDGGLTWDSIHVYSYMAGAQSQNGVLYIASTYGAVKKSTDFGMTWSNFDDGSRFDYIPCMTIDSSNVLYVGSENGLFTYDTGMGEWRQLNSWTPSAAYTAPSGIKIIGGHYGDIVYSAEPDSLWPLVNIMAPGAQVQSITSFGDWVFAAPQNRGVIRSRLPGLTKPASISKSPSNSGFPKLTLYPNPATAKCTVSFLSGNTQPVVCELYSIYGRKLRSWSVTSNGLATNQNSFSTSDLVSGVYFLHASNVSWSATAKFVKM